MQRLLALLLTLAVAACSADSTTSPTPADNHQTVSVNDRLRLEAEDFPAPGGVLFVLPSVTPASNSIVVSSTQYGSLCRTALTGDAAINGQTIGVRVRFTERLTVCTAEIRALSYTATVSGVPTGTYDVAVIHEYNNSVDTVVRRSVAVP
jgi:hypothetical protein